MMLKPHVWILAAVASASFFAMAQDQPLIPFAYLLNTPGAPAAPKDDGSPKHVPNSQVAFALPQIRDLFNVPDWHPDNHPAMPEIVSHGRKPEVRACGYCHLPNGQGRPENAGLTGLPAAYIVQQMADYKAGLRKSSEPKMGPPAAMLALAKAATEEEAKAAAAYFSGFKYNSSWIKVTEAAMVPKTRVTGGMMTPIEGGGTEPIGQRVVEVAVNPEATELRDSGSGFIAYVPVGSIKTGETLATTGGAGKTVRCSICHGADLKGLGNVPPLAGRSPSYLVRQMWDIKSGNRNGAGAQLMKEAVSKLSVDDMVMLAAYAASRN
jgi:cytochrome c553